MVLNMTSMVNQFMVYMYLVKKNYISMLKYIKMKKKL